MPTLNKPTIVMWFSAGVSSAVSAWIMRGKIDRLVYIHIEDQESDTLRFLNDCEKWIGIKIEIIQSPLKTVENACRFAAYVNGPRGAACTKRLKRQVRKEWESANTFFNRFSYVWGMDATEQKRATKLQDEMPQQDHAFPLIDLQIDKEEAHGILSKAGISRPRMYDLGFPNNNCVGCVKGGMWYWNLIRKVYPEVFESRAKMERVICGTCLKKQVKGPDGKMVSEKLYLDELDPNAGRDEGPIVAECGAACEIIAEVE